MQKLLGRLPVAAGPRRSLVQNAGLLLPGAAARPEGLLRHGERGAGEGQATAGARLLPGGRPRRAAATRRPAAADHGGVRPVLPAAGGARRRARQALLALGWRPLLTSRFGCSSALQHPRPSEPSQALCRPEDDSLDVLRLPEPVPDAGMYDAALLTWRAFEPSHLGLRCGLYRSSASHQCQDRGLDVEGKIGIV